MGSNSLIIKRAYLFEELIKDMFIALAIEILSENVDIKINNKYLEMDLYVLFKEVKYIVEVKYGSTSKYDKRNFDLSVQKLKFTCNNMHIKNSCIFTFYIVSDEIKSDLNKENILVYDIRNLLYIFNKIPDLRDRFFSILSYAIDDIEEQEPDDELLGVAIYNLLQFKVYYNDVPQSTKTDYINELDLIVPGKADFRRYEKYCKKILMYLFDNSLDRWREQEDSGEGMFVFDIICKIKDNAPGFWELIKNKFNSRYVIFEFKNYSDDITQKEIYTTEKYLFNTALRNVAIIITRKGIDDNAKKAIKGALREQGKLIIVLNDEDIKNMIGNDNITAIDYLEDKLDEFLIELDK